MKTYLLLMLFAMTVTACTEERTMIRDNSAGAKFSSLFNNDARWQMSDREDQKVQVDKDGRPVVLQDAPNNFAGYHIVTSFQTDPAPQSPAAGQASNGAGQGENLSRPAFPNADPWTAPAPQPASPR